MKSEQEKIEKYSIKDIEPLIKSIIKAYPEHNLNEELICINLEYNGGYISQLRSRENKEEKPQVSPKFYNQLLNFRLQNANFLTGQVENQSGDTKDLAASYERLLQEKEKTIAKSEEKAALAEKYANDVKQFYEDAKAEKLKLIDIINDTLKEISGNLKDTAASLKSNHDSLLAIGRTVRSNDAEMMEALDHLEGNPVGTRQKRSHTVQKALRQGVEKGGKKTGQGKISKDVNEL